MRALAGKPDEQRGEFVVYVVVLGVIEVQAVDGIHQLARGLARHQRAQHDHNSEQQREDPQHPVHAPQRGFVRFRKAQSRAIGEPHGKIVRALSQRIGKPRAAARARRKRCLHFRAVRVVLHLRAVRFAIEQHAAILGDPGHARARHKAFQKRLRIRGLVHAQRGDAGFPLHRIVQFFGCRIVKCP